MGGAESSGGETIPPCVLLLGPPAAGKGTQAPRLAGWLGVPHVSTGDLLRQLIAKGGEIGGRMKEILGRGELIPEENVLPLVVARLDQPDCENGVLLDGFPRNRAQAEWLDEELRRRRHDGRLQLADVPSRRLGDLPDGALIGAICIDLGASEVTRRLAGRRICPDCKASYHVEFAPAGVEGRCDECDGTLIQRRDDNPDSIRTRLDVFARETEPLLAYYEAGGRLVRVRGEGEIGDIATSIVSCYRRLAGDCGETS